MIAKKQHGETNISNSEKSELKEYLSDTYEVDKDNIKIN